MNYYICLSLCYKDTNAELASVSMITSGYTAAFKIMSDTTAWINGDSEELEETISRTLMKALGELIRGLHSTDIKTFNQITYMNCRVLYKD